MITDLAEPASDLYFAASSGDEDRVARLLRDPKNEKIINESFQLKVEGRECLPSQMSRVNALHIAAAQGYVGVVRALLRSSTLDVNKITDKKRFRKTPSSRLAGGDPRDLLHNIQVQKTALHLAVEGGHTEVVEALLQDPRIDVNAQSFENWKVVFARLSRKEHHKIQRCPVHMAAFLGYLPIVRMLVEHPMYNPRLPSKEKRVAKEWTDEQRPINGSSKRKEEHLKDPIHWAAQGGHVEVLRFLMAHGADVNSRSRYFYEHCVFRIYPELNTAAFEVVQSSGGDYVPHQCPVHLAARKGHIDALRLLLADPRTRNDIPLWNGRTLLDEAQATQAPEGEAKRAVCKLVEDHLNGIPIEAPTDAPFAQGSLSSVLSAEPAAPAAATAPAPAPAAEGTTFSYGADPEPTAPATAPAAPAPPPANGLHRPRPCSSGFPLLEWRRFDDAPLLQFGAPAPAPAAASLLSSINAPPSFAYASAAAVPPSDHLLFALTAPAGATVTPPASAGSVEAPAPASGAPAPQPSNDLTSLWSAFSISGPAAPAGSAAPAAPAAPNPFDFPAPTSQAPQVRPGPKDTPSLLPCLDPYPGRARLPTGSHLGIFSSAVRAPAGCLMLAPRQSGSEKPKGDEIDGVPAARRVPIRSKDGPGSKYDYVKVLIHLKEGHYYVLSRFLISRALETIQIPLSDAQLISLSLKKELVDRNLLNISQHDMDQWLVWLLAVHGYDQPYFPRYRMMGAFYQHRIPLVVLIAGTGAVAKSTIATQLAHRLNLPNVLQTDLVYDIIGGEGPSLWEMRFERDEDFLAEYRRRARLVRQGVDYDMHKALKEGKPIIIEGSYVDPALYAPFFDPALSAAALGPAQPLGPPAPARHLLSFFTPDSAWSSSPAAGAAQLGPGVVPLADEPPPAMTCRPLPRPPQQPHEAQTPLSLSATPTNSRTPLAIRPPSGAPAGPVEPEYLSLATLRSLVKGAAPTSPDQRSGEGFPGVKAVAVAYILRGTAESQRVLLDGWLTAHHDQAVAFGATRAEQSREAQRRFDVLQRYLCGAVEGLPGARVVPVEANLEATVTRIHSLFLERITDLYVEPRPPTPPDVSPFDPSIQQQSLSSLSGEAVLMPPPASS
ncbi:putative 2-phosphoglycerate kinase [Paratrimastix pyriformis]|uniref:2-phosphoglycerate kinase n=1 Tax=Paratrimastix pyriformis TaxID=342808 RepID=A0ABQ8UCX0_9EUKA|nr:putative 2-phosphoglycerate kinase [Paratrimastix pyriformis]